MGRNMGGLKAATLESLCPVSMYDGSPVAV